MAIYVPIVMYGLRLFVVVLQELHCLPNICAGRHGVLSVCKVSFLNSVRF